MFKGEAGFALIKIGEPAIEPLILELGNRHNSAELRGFVAWILLKLGVDTRNLSEPDAEVCLHEGLATHSKAVALSSRAEGPQDSIDTDGKMSNVYYYLAIGHFTEAIRINPRYAQAYVRRGISYSSAGASAMGLADFTDAIALDRELALAWYLRGLAFALMNEPMKARRDWRMGTKLDPRGPTGDSARATLRESRSGLLRTTGCCLLPLPALVAIVGAIMIPVRR
jgi:tetratricopeptide (TPR) repeat protein